MKARFYLPVAFVSFLFVLGACASKKGEQSSSVLFQEWKLLKRKDSYTGNWQKQTGKTSFFFKEGGGFMEKKTSKTCSGEFSRISDTLKITHNCNSSELVYIIENLQKDSLLLSIRGRHGKVYYQFTN